MQVGTIQHVRLKIEERQRRHGVPRLWKGASERVFLGLQPRQLHGRPLRRQRT